MQKDVCWTEECIQRAQGSHPTIGEAVSNRIRALIEDQGERVLRGPELTSTAKALLSDIAAAPSTKETQEP